MHCQINITMHCRVNVEMHCQINITMHCRISITMHCRVHITKHALNVTVEPHAHRDMRNVTPLYICGTNLYYACTSRYARRDLFIRMRDSFILCMYIEICATWHRDMRDVFGDPIWKWNFTLVLHEKKPPRHYSIVREQALKSTHIHTHTHAHTIIHSPFRSLFSSVSRTHCRVFIPKHALNVTVEPRAHRDMRDVTPLYICGTHLFYTCTSKSRTHCRVFITKQALKVTVEPRS